MDYLLKSSAIIFIFYTCYKLFLQRDTFFESNRWFLLSGLIIASVISLIVIPNYIEYSAIDYSQYVVTNHNDSTLLVEDDAFNYSNLLVWIYVFGLLFFIGKLGIELLSLKRILNSGATNISGRFKLIETNEHVAPFSFFNYIVYNPKQFSNEELQHIINHEKAHTQHFHSLDTIIAQIACVLLWFNPFVWLYKKALQQNLEFIADQKAQHVSFCEKSYQTVLLKTSVKNHQLVLTNNFYTSLIKKRIIMLHKSKSKKLNQLKLITVLPLLALFIMSFNTKDIYIKLEAKDTITLEDFLESDDIIEIDITKNTSDSDLESTKKELKTKGITFNYSNVKRNSEDEITSIDTEFKNNNNSSYYNISGENGIKSFRFISSEDTFSIGSIDKNNYVYDVKTGTVKIKSSKGSNSLVVIEEDENNTPTTIDVRTLKNEDSIYFIRKNNKFTFSTGDTKDSNVIFHESDEPIFIINGKKVEKSIFEDVDSEDIESVFVLKGKKAVEKFGNEGKNGAIVMTKRGYRDQFSKSEDHIITTSKNQFRLESDEDNPLIILDGKVIDKDDINKVNPNDIDNVEVLKDKSAIKLYGKKGENGVIIINTTKNASIESKNKGILIEKEDGSPYQVEVSNVYVAYESNEVLTEFIITKNSSDSSLEQQKAELKKHGIDAKFSKIKRNKAGEITSIKISLDDNNGRKSSASWKEKNQAIPDIVLGKSIDDKLFIRANGN